MKTINVKFKSDQYRINYAEIRSFLIVNDMQYIEDYKGQFDDFRKLLNVMLMNDITFEVNHDYFKTGEMMFIKFNGILYKHPVLNMINKPERLVKVKPKRTINVKFKNEQCRNAYFNTLKQLYDKKYFVECEQGLYELIILLDSKITSDTIFKVATTTFTKGKSEFIKLDGIEYKHSLAYMFAIQDEVNLITRV